MTIRAIILNIILQVLVIFGFITAANLLPKDWLKVSVLIIFVISTCLVIYHSFQKYNLRKMTFFSLLVSLSFVIIFKVIGYCFYPGLVKDVELFSSYNLFLSFKEFIILFIFYSFCCLCLFFKTKKA